MNHAEMKFLDIEFPYKDRYDNYIGGKWVPRARDSTSTTSRR